MGGKVSWSFRSSLQLGNDCRQCINAELGSVEGGQRKAAECLGDLRGRYAASLLRRFATQKICEY